MKKKINNILLGLQYTVVGAYMIMGIIHNETAGITIGLSMLIMTVLYHMRKEKLPRTVKCWTGSLKGRLWPRRL